MTKIPKRTARALAVAAVVGAIGSSGVALAAGGLAAPQLRYPEGKSVPAGHVTLRVYVPNPSVVINRKIFFILTDKRIVKGGLLDLPARCGFRCIVTTMKSAGHAGHLFTYSDHFQFPGLWQDTPGRYYWQAYYYPNTGVLGVVPSRIGSFRIVG